MTPSTTAWGKPLSGPREVDMAEFPCIRLSENLWNRWEVNMVLRDVSASKKVTLVSLRPLNYTLSKMTKWQMCKRALKYGHSSHPGSLGHPGHPGHPGRPGHPGHPECCPHEEILWRIVTLWVLDTALEAKVLANKDESKCLKPLIAVIRPVRGLYVKNLE